MPARGVFSFGENYSNETIRFRYNRFMAETADFESSLKRLEEIVRKLEGGDQPLDSALELFEEGIKLSRFCHSKLEQAERRVAILVKNESGQTREVPFESENEG